MSSWCPFWRTRFLASPKMRGQAPSCGCTASHFVSSSLYSNTFVGARGCLVSYSLQGRCLSDNGIASHVTEMTRRRRGCRCLSAARRGAVWAVCILHTRSSVVCSMLSIASALVYIPKDPWEPVTLPLFGCLAS